MTLANDSVSFEKAKEDEGKSPTGKDKSKQSDELTIESKSLDDLLKRFQSDFNVRTEIKVTNEAKEVALLGSKSVNSLRLKEISESSP